MGHRVGIGLLCFAFGFSLFGAAHPTDAAAKLQDQQESNVDAYPLNPDSYRNDPKAGFKAAMKLIAKAQKEEAPPETVARLYYFAARFQRSIDFQHGQPPKVGPAISILNSVVKHPDRFTANYDSSIWYTNCVSLIASMYQRLGGKDEEIASILKTASGAIQSADHLSTIERLKLDSRIRMSGSDVALGSEDWEKAIAWVAPVIQAADQFLQDKDGAASIAMSTRQQSMFLANHGDYDQSSELIDAMCVKLEQAAKISIDQKISLQCMLRGKHLLNFSNAPDHDHAIAGWEKYFTLRKRALRYDGKDAAIVKRACANMDRLAVGCLDSSKLDEGVSIVKQNLEMMKADPELRDPSFRALWYLQDMTRMVQQDLVRQNDPRAEELKRTVDEFVQQCRAEAKKK